VEDKHEPRKNIIPYIKKLKQFNVYCLRFWSSFIDFLDLLKSLNCFVHYALVCMLWFFFFLNSYIFSFMYLGCVSLSASSLKKLKKTRTNTNNNNNKNKADVFHFHCCSKRSARWWKIQKKFRSDLIVPGVLLVGEKHEDFSKVV